MFVISPSLLVSRMGATSSVKSPGAAPGFNSRPRMGATVGLYNI